MELIDTHAHLGDPQFARDRQEVLARAARSGVTRVIEIADSPAEWDAAVAFARANPQQVRCALGLHPYHASEFSEELLARLKARAQDAEVVAIGEVGLDYAKSDIPGAVQRAVLERMLSACRQWDMPAVIHCREAYEDLEAILRNLYKAPPRDHRFWGVVHCFSGDAQDAVLCASLGFALGVDGPVTYPKNGGLREAFRAAGASSLVLETDSPYLPPQSSRGKRNEPAAIREIAGKIAEVLGLPFEEASRATTENARALFKL